LVMGLERENASREGISAFSTPTVVHYGTVLLVSAILVAPWRSMTGPIALVGIAGFGGIAYVLRVTLLAKRVSGYEPDLDDWIWYSLMPLVAYAALLVGAVMLVALPADAMFGIAGSVALLLLIGVRNAWDIVTYLAVKEVDPPDRR
ncbi:MAG: hypothetical protein ACLQPV_01420, partial [Vulcanimicrobiaceae bacterium]